MTRRNPRRPSGRVLAARWAVVSAGAAVLAATVLAALGIIPTHAAPTPAVHPCTVVAYDSHDDAVCVGTGPFATESAR